MSEPSKFDIMKMALSNEVAIDRYCQVYQNRDRLQDIPVIRPLNVFPKFKNDRVIRLLSLALLILWLPVFMLAVVYKYAKYLRRAGKKSAIAVDDRVVVATLKRVQDLLPAISSDVKPRQFLSVPWISVERLEEDSSMKGLGVLEIISRYQLLIVMIDACRGLFFWVGHIRSPYHLFQSYALFDFFLLYRGLKNLKEEGCESFWFANHYDRMAILLDQLGTKDNCMIQHGVLDQRCVVPHKLEKVSRVYYINDQERSILSSLYVVDHSKVNFELLPLAIEVTPVPDGDCAFLLVSRPAQLAFDIELVKAFANEANPPMIYIKPHPIFDDAEYHSNFGSISYCKVIEDRYFFPDVPVVVSYRSTLAVEYECAGMQVIDLTDHDATHVFNQVYYHLSSVKTPHQ